MTTVSRTNIITVPDMHTGWSGRWFGGGTAAGTYTLTTGTNAVGGPNFLRKAWTAGGGGNGDTGFDNGQGAFAPVTAGQVYTFSGYLRPSVGGKTSVAWIQFFDTGNTAIGGRYKGSQVSLPANVWTRVSTSAVTAPAGAVSASVSMDINGPSTPVWNAGDTLDGCAPLLEQSATVGTYFDGSTAAVNNLAYQWTGTANASTSQEYYALPTVLTVAKTDAPCPRTEVTVVGLGTGTTVFNVWRTSDGKRKAVRGARLRSGVDSDFVVDYEAPLNRVLTYDIEVISGAQVTQPTYPATVTVLSSTWWIQDPLVPSSAIPLNVSKQDSNAPYLTGNAIRSLDYGASVTLIPILGSPDPVALMGNRTIAGNVTFDMFTNLASVTTQLRNLIQQTPLLLIRSTGTRNNGIPGLAYFTSAKPSEKPVTVAFGGTLTNWSLTGDLVAAPTMNVLVPIWTYGTVAALWTTYQQAQTTLAGKTYLDVLKSPSGV